MKLSSMRSHFGCICGVVGHQQCVLIAVLVPSRSFKLTQQRVEVLSVVETTLLGVKTRGTSGHPRVGVNYQDTQSFVK